MNQHIVLRALLQITLVSMLLGMLPPAAVHTLAAPDAALSTLPATQPMTELSVAPAPRAATANEQQAATAAFGKLPLAFVPNEGQHAKDVRYHVRGNGGNIFFTPQEVVFAIPSEPIDEPQRGRGQGNAAQANRPIALSVVRLRYEGAGAKPTLTSAERLPGMLNYFLGNDPANWRVNVPAYAGINYHQLYPGIDLTFSGTDGQLKSTYTVAPGADLGRLRWRYQGAKDVQLDAAGNLLISIKTTGRPRADSTTSFTLIEQAPIAWQVINGQRILVDVRFVVAPSKAVSFALGAYDTTLPIVIDPTLVYSTYLGGSGHDIGYDIVLDSVGNAYITGKTTSTTFPTQGALDGTANGSYDVFVAKLNPSGSALIYSTYLGGSNADAGYGIAVDTSGNVYVAGQTESATFPIQNAYQSTYAGGPGGPSIGDAFVAKINATGNQLLYSSFLGGSGGDWISDIAVDASGNLFVTGSTYLPPGTVFPTKHALKSVVTGSTDAFLARINPAASGNSSLIYSTLLGGSDHDYGNAVVIDSSGNNYITGKTSSFADATHTPFPTTAGAYRTSKTTADTDAFITKLTWNGTNNVTVHGVVDRR